MDFLITVGVTRERLARLESIAPAILVEAAAVDPTSFPQFCPAMEVRQ